MKTQSVVFPNLPFNTTSIYSMAVCHDGCEIYLPANTKEEAKKTKEDVQKFLDDQPMPTRIIA